MGAWIVKQTLHKEAKQKRARQCMISKLFAIQTVSLIVSTYCFVSSPKLVSANRLISARIHSEYVMLPGFTLAIVANPGQSCFLICDHARPAPSGARGYILCRETHIQLDLLFWNQPQPDWLRLSPLMRWTWLHQRKQWVKVELAVNKRSNEHGTEQTATRFQQ